MTADGTYSDDVEFSASNGWEDNFMKRHGLSLRRSTTQYQKPPSDYVPKIVAFILYVRNLISDNSILPAGIYACDETALWLDASSSSTVCETGSREVSIRTTGHDKLRVTVLLCAKADGVKLKPYIL